MVKKYGVILEGKMVTVCVYGREEGMECGGGGGGGEGGSEKGCVITKLLW